MITASTFAACPICKKSPEVKVNDDKTFNISCRTGCDGMSLEKASPAEWHALVQKTSLDLREKENARLLKVHTARREKVSEWLEYWKAEQEAEGDVSAYVKSAAMLLEEIDASIRHVS